MSAEEAMEKPELGDEEQNEEQTLLVAFENGEFRSDLDEERRRSLVNSAAMTLAGK